MIYLVSKILAFLLVALVVGYWLGSAVYRARARQSDSERESVAAELENRIESLQEEVRLAKLNADAEAAAKSAATAKVAEIESRNQNAEQRVEAAISRAEALEESLDRERQVLTEADEALRELREEHQRTLTALEEAQAQQSTSEGDDEARRTELEVLVRDRDTWQADAQAAIQQVEALQAELTEARLQVSGSEEAQRALRVQLESFERRTEEMVLRSNAQTEEIAQKEARIAELEARAAGIHDSRVGMGDLPALNEAGFFASPPVDVDDLKLISGVGPKLERLLNNLGIYQFQQIALLTSTQIDWVNEQLSFKGRIERDNWIKQAALLGGISVPSEEAEISPGSLAQ